MKKVINTATDPKPEWLMGGNPSAIEAQEAQGQRELTRSKQEGIVQQLPVKINSGGKNAKDEYEKMGIKVIGKTKGDDQFYDVKLPVAWNINPTDHPMWSTLFDEHGKKRATIFYKAAFYDREAFVNIV